jgi:hypothetical protein
VSRGRDGPGPGTDGPTAGRGNHHRPDRSGTARRWTGPFYRRPVRTPWSGPAPSVTRRRAAGPAPPLSRGRSAAYTGRPPLRRGRGRARPGAGRPRTGARPAPAS